MTELKSNGTAVGSGTIWGVLIGIVGPMIMAKTGLTPDEVLNTTNMIVAAGAGIFAIYKRITAKKKITKVA